MFRSIILPLLLKIIIIVIVVIVIIINTIISMTSWHRHVFLQQRLKTNIGLHPSEAKILCVRFQVCFSNKTVKFAHKKNRQRSATWEGKHFQQHLQQSSWKGDEAYEFNSTSRRREWRQWMVFVTLSPIESQQQLYCNCIPVIRVLSLTLQLQSR